MKKTMIAVTLSLLTMSGLVYANNSDNTVGKTRAEVVAELKVAQANGELNVSREYDYPKETFVSTKTRAQVMDEFAESKKSGEYRKMQEFYRN